MYNNRRDYGHTGSPSESHATPSWTSRKVQAYPDKASASVDLSAPVIHFGTNREVPSRYSMREQHFVRAHDDRVPLALTAQSKESKLLTLFVSKLPEELSDQWLEKIFKSTAKLQGWKRALCGTGKGLSYGFVTYEDPESLRRAYNVLKDIKVPEARGCSNRRPLQIKQDPTSELYVEDYLNSKGTKFDEQKERNSVSSATGQIEKILRDFANPDYKLPAVASSAPQKVRTEDAASKQETAVTIMLSIEDELGDIPEEQRASIAKEITSFRERSARRDQERARQIADVENRRLEVERANRNDRKQSGRGQDTEGVELIRRARGKQHNVEEERMSEREIAEHRARNSLDVDNRAYENQVASWQSREDARLRLLHADVTREQDDNEQARSDALYEMERLAKFDDDKEACQAKELFLGDRTAWSRSRSAAKSREVDSDRREEERYGSDFSTIPKSTPSNSFTIAVEHVQTKEKVAPLKFAIDKTSDDSKRVVMPPQSGLVYEDEDETPRTRRPLVPLIYADDSAEKEITISQPPVSSEQNLVAIANRIPQGKKELWAFPISWNLLTEGLMHKIRAYVGKKVQEVIGMEEEDLISAVMSIIEAKGSGAQIEDELVAAIGDAEDSEMTAIKIWRFLLLLLESAASQ